MPFPHSCSYQMHDWPTWFFFEGLTQVYLGGIILLSIFLLLSSWMSHSLSRVWCLSFRLRLLHFARSLTSKMVSIFSVANSSSVFGIMALDSIKALRSKADMMFNMHPHKWGNGDNCRQRFWLKSQSPAYGLISLILYKDCPSSCEQTSGPRWIPWVPSHSCQFLTDIRFEYKIMKKIQTDQKRVQDLWNDLVAVCEKYEWMNHCTDEAHVKFIHPKDNFFIEKICCFNCFSYLSPKASKNTQKQHHRRFLTYYQVNHEIKE